MSLISLPPEIFDCVVANIASQSAPCSLARCSRQLYRCTIPHLYGDVSTREVVTQENQQQEKLINLASLLLRRPDLARLVRNFTLHAAWGEDHLWYEGEFPEKPDGQVVATVDNMFTLSTEEKIKCLRQFSHGHGSHFDLILALVLPALVNMKKLVLDLDIDHETCYLEDMIRRAARREKLFDIQPPFEALTSICILHGQTFSRNPGFMASLLRLPALQDISISVEGWWDPEEEEDVPGEFGPPDKNLIELGSSSSPLTNLHLYNYKLGTVNLSHMLRAPKALKALFYKFYSPNFINPTDIRQGLGPQKNCLESLAFDLDRTYYGRTHVLGPMTSLISFSALKVFKTPAIFLTGTDNGNEHDNLINIFPPNLETLHLIHFQIEFESLLEALESLLARKSPQQIPSLKNLILEEMYSPVARLYTAVGVRPGRLVDVAWKGTQETAIGRLRRVAAAQGVSLDVIEEANEVKSFLNKPLGNSESGGGESDSDEWKSHI
ncbi:hypothetical protein MMC22_005741, partial [Lobaria immixta]|nr:hypothetical protein [Lobaria immixta]